MRKASPCHAVTMHAVYHELLFDATSYFPRDAGRLLHHSLISCHYAETMAVDFGPWWHWRWFADSFWLSVCHKGYKKGVYYWQNWPLFKRVFLHTAYCGDIKHISICVIMSPSSFEVHKFIFTRPYSVATSVVLAWHVYSHCIKYSEKFPLILMWQVNLLTFSMMMVSVLDWLSTGVTCSPISTTDIWYMVFVCQELQHVSLYRSINSPDKTYIWSLRRVEYWVCINSWHVNRRFIFSFGVHGYSFFPQKYNTAIWCNDSHCYSSIVWKSLVSTYYQMQWKISHCVHSYHISISDIL